MNNVLEPINWTALKHKHDVCELMHCNQSHCKEYSGTKCNGEYWEATCLNYYIHKSVNSKNIESGVIFVDD